MGTATTLCREISSSEKNMCFGIILHWRSGQVHVEIASNLQRSYPIQHRLGVQSEFFKWVYIDFSAAGQSE